MIEPGGDCKKAVESSSGKLECSEEEIYDSKVIDDNYHTSKLDNDSPLEQSFEVISQSFSKSDNMESNENVQEQESTQANDLSSKPRSNSDLRNTSFQQRLKKSGSFLAKLQSSSEDNGSSNIQSSIASAFSSFASNFTLNSSTNGDHLASSLTIETASTSTKLSQLTETKEDVFHKKAILERKNLISLTKLIVKDLISTSLLASRTIDDCSNVTHLNNYFTLIDRVLKHGLKQNLLSSKSASLWNALDSLPKYLKESTLMSESVRSLANTKTPDGRIKAWLRLAMMQKKLPEYFNELLANKNVLLKDIYHDHAFILNDEAHVFAGLIIGVNVIDCNFFVKDANFDLMDDVIDLSPYLKMANSYDGEQDGQPSGKEINLENLTVALDQKNYLEEWNKRLETTISNLQTKIKSLEEHNSKLEMEIKLSEVKIRNLQKKHGEIPSEKQSSNTNSSITDAIKNFIVNTDPSSTKNSESTKSVDGSSRKEFPDQGQLISIESTTSSIVAEQKINSTTDPSTDEEQQLIKEKRNQSDSSTSFNQLQLDKNVYDELKRRFVAQENELSSLKERASILEGSYRTALEKIKVLERDLDVQTSMNADKETTIKIYEKDIREKQAQVESLRNSLGDSKKLNSELNEKLNEVNNKMKDRIKSVSNLQDTLSKWKLENKTLATRLQDKQTAFKSISSELEKCLTTIEELKKYNETVNEDLKRERESGQSSSVTVEEQNSRILGLNEKLVRLEREFQEVKHFKDKTDELTKRCRDYEQSLEEIGSQLRESRLEVENLKENSAVFLDSQWMDSKQVKSCALCLQLFSVTRRKHHCRLCGNVFCQTCSDNKMELASSSKPVRVCDTCHAFLLAKFVKSST